MPQVAKGERYLQFRGIFSSILKQSMVCVLCDFGGKSIYWFSCMHTHTNEYMYVHR